MEDNNLCPCGSHRHYKNCCGRYIEGHELPNNAEALMRSRYTAYKLLREDYLLATWYPTARPRKLNLAKRTFPIRWIRLNVLFHEQQDAEHAIVEFIAYYHQNGFDQKLHENSRFVYENGQWFYLDGIELCDDY